MLEWLVGWAVGVAVVLSTTKVRRLLTYVLLILLAAGAAGFIVVDPFKHELAGATVFTSLQFITAAVGIIAGTKTYPAPAALIASVMIIIMVLIPFAFIGYLGFPIGFVMGALVNKRSNKLRQVQEY